MEKSIKFKDNVYWDSSGISHNKELLSNILGNFGKFGRLYQSTFSIAHTATAWTRTKLPINDWSWTTNDTKLFEKGDNCIKCNFTGTVLIIRYASLNVSNQFDIYDSSGRTLEVKTYVHRNIDIRNVDYSSIYFEYQLGTTDFLTYLGSQMLILRLS